MPFSGQWVTRIIGSRPIWKVDGRIFSDDLYWEVNWQDEIQPIQPKIFCWAFSLFLYRLFLTFPSIFFSSSSLYSLPSSSSFFYFSSLLTDVRSVPLPWYHRWIYSTWWHVPRSISKLSGETLQLAGAQQSGSTSPLWPS